MSLISVSELADRLTQPGPSVVVCDVRYSLADHDQGRRQYDAGHIPGAVFVDLERQLADRAGRPQTEPERGGRHPLPPVAEFTRLLGANGIRPGDLVVAYDASGGATAARLWWMLRSIGHGQVAVLDGGYPAWVAGGHPIGTEPAVPIATEYPASEGWTGIVDADAVDATLALGGTVIDSRAGERYRGEIEPIDAVPGHIPGAINLFHADNLTADGHHRPLDELAARFAGVGQSPIVYCGSGVTACHNLLAMSLVGVERARLYPGSWSEWSATSGRPIATGQAPTAE